MKRKPSLLEIDAMRTEWRKQHPEEAARREFKRKLRGDVGYHELEREPDENIIDLPPVESLSESELNEVKKEMTDLWRAMYDRRQEYLKSRDLLKAALTEDEKRRFKEYILRFEGDPGFSMETENLLIEGLRYPEAPHDIAEFCFKYLDTKYDRGEKPSSTLWLGIWSRSFVPLDAVRLMIRHDNERGTYHKRECFEKLWPLLEEHAIKHCDQAQKLVNEANDKQDDAAGRRACRMFFFQVLIYTFQKQETM
jgi:hypothetical protein